MGEIRAVAKAMEIPEAGLIFAAIKPPGMTSHDVVDFMRRLCGTRRCGHAGTLDPAACGVLVLLVGRATRLSPHIMAYEKSYIVEVTFGLATDTGDVEGRVIEERPAEHVTEQRVREALSEICGVLVMKPHKYSAVKLAGRKAYEAARAGEQVELPERTVVIRQARLLSFTPGGRPRALVEIICGKGTYIRSIAELLGHKLESCAYASFMLRRRVGPLDVSQAWTLEELAALAAEGRLGEAAVPAEQALGGYRQITVAGHQARLLRSGTPVPVPEAGSLGETVAVFDEGGALICMAEVRGGRPQLLQPRTVLQTGG